MELLSNKQHLASTRKGILIGSTLLIMYPFWDIYIEVENDFRRYTVTTTGLGFVDCFFHLLDATSLTKPVAGSKGCIVFELSWRSFFFSYCQIYCSRYPFQMSWDASRITEFSLSKFELFHDCLIVVKYSVSTEKWST